VVRELLWSAEFSLEAFARKSAARADVFVTVSTLGRSVHAMTLALFALNRRHWLNDKSAMAEVGELERCPRDYRLRVERVLADPGLAADRLTGSVRLIREVFDEVAALAGDLYQPKFDLGARVGLSRYERG
jgi:hypothetical protein